MTEALAVGGLPDAGQILVEPDDEVAEQHDVVARVHLGFGGVAVPQFPDGRGSVLHHESPAGEGGIGGQPISQVAPSALGQSAHHLLGAQYARADVAVELVAELLHHVGKHAVAMGWLHQSPA